MNSQLSGTSRALLDERVRRGVLPYENYGVSAAREMIAANARSYDHMFHDGEVSTICSQELSCGFEGTYHWNGAHSGEEGSRPTVVFFHGGGWMFPEQSAHRLLAARIAAQSGWGVLSVRYRLAPENEYPAALDDCRCALEWLGRCGSLHGADAKRVVLAGDSAGGTLAAALGSSQPSRGVRVIGQILLYPSLDQVGTYDSQAISLAGMTITHRTMNWFRDNYLGSGDDRSDPLISPLFASDRGETIPSLVVSAGFDTLCGEAFAFEAGSKGACEHLHFPGELHGFLTTTPSNPATIETLRQVCGFLNDLRRTS